MHYLKQSVDFSRIQTRIVEIEGEPDDHWTTTIMAHRHVVDIFNW